MVSVSDFEVMAVIQPFAIGVLETIGRLNSHGLEVEIEERLFAISHRRAVITGQDAPLAFRDGEAGQTQAEVYQPMAGTVFAVHPIGRTFATMIAPPIAAFILEGIFTGE
jgi:hypothetical protein